MDLSKLSPEFAADVNTLSAVRLDIASRNRDLAERELGARLLRTEREQDLRTRMTKSDAEREARVDPAYLDYERETIRLTFERDFQLAKAEGQRLTLQAFIQLQGVAA